MSTYVVRTLALCALALTLTGCSREEGKREVAAGTSTQAGEQSVPEQGYPTRVFFGDTHLHTAMSMDAGAFGNRLGIEDAYRFARGDEVTASSRQKAKLSRPLDFLVVAITPTIWASSPTCSRRSLNCWSIPPARSGPT